MLWLYALLVNGMRVNPHCALVLLRAGVRSVRKHFAYSFSQPIASLGILNPGLEIISLEE